MWVTIPSDTGMVTQKLHEECWLWNYFKLFLIPIERSDAIALSFRTTSKTFLGSCTLTILWWWEWDNSYFPCNFSQHYKKLHAFHHWNLLWIILTYFIYIYLPLMCEMSGSCASLLLKMTSSALWVWPGSSVDGIGLLQIRRGWWLLRFNNIKLYNINYSNNI